MRVSVDAPAGDEGADKDLTIRPDAHIAESKGPRWAAPDGGEDEASGSKPAEASSMGYPAIPSAPVAGPSSSDDAVGVGAATRSSPAIAAKSANARRRPQARRHRKRPCWRCEAKECGGFEI